MVAKLCAVVTMRRKKERERERNSPLRRGGELYVRLDDDGDYVRARDYLFRMGLGGGGGNGGTMTEAGKGP